MGRTGLEERADHMLVDRRASDREEIVGVGFFEADVWLQLPNIAMSGQFRITGEDVKRAIEQLSSTSPSSGPVQYITLWHSHYHRDEPSKMDLDNFPGWAKSGIVYHAPTKATIHYSKRGIISTVSTRTHVE